MDELQQREAMLAGRPPRQSRSGSAGSDVQLNKLDFRNANRIALAADDAGGTSACPYREEISALVVLLLSPTDASPARAGAAVSVPPPQFGGGTEVAATSEW
jgi:hypothetical protein